MGSGGPAGKITPFAGNPKGKQKGEFWGYQHNNPTIVTCQGQVGGKTKSRHPAHEKARKGDWTLQREGEGEASRLGVWTRLKNVEEGG